MLESIEQFGVKAILGRDVLSYGEISRMKYARLIPALFHSREKAENWAAWVRDNREQASLLNEAEKLYNGE